jgi:uncharacterized membrane protein YGL010W
MASPSAFSTRSTKTSTSSPTFRPWSSSGRRIRAGHAAFALEADVDHGLVVFDRGDGALDDAAFKAAVAGAAELFVEERREIVAGGVGGRCHWIIQFIGHAFEGRKPAFLDDLKSLLVGPLFVVAELAFMLGLRRELEAAIRQA